jgi:hypothetical protein
MNSFVFSGSDSDDDDDGDDDDLDSSNDEDVVHDIVLSAIPQRSLQSTTDSRRRPQNLDSSSSDDEYPSLSDTLSPMKRALGVPAAANKTAPLECVSTPVAASTTGQFEVPRGQGPLALNDSDSDDDDGIAGQRQTEHAISSTLVAIASPVASAPAVLPPLEPTEDEDLNPTPSLPLYPQV